MGKQKRRRNRQHQLRIYYGWHEDYWLYITTTEYEVYACIASYADWDTGTANPIFKTIHLDTGISIDAIRYAVRWLEAIGVLYIEFRKARNQDGVEYGRKRYFYTITHQPKAMYQRSDNKVNKKQIKALMPRKHEIIGG